MQVEERQLRLEDNNEKLSSLRNAYESDPDNKETGAELARFYADLGWLNQAMNIYKRMLKKYSEDFSLLLDYGNVLVNRDDLDEAQRIFRKLTVIKPQRVEGWNNLGITCFKKSETDAARDAFKQVLSIEPDNAGAMMNLGNYYHLKDEIDKAVDFFKNAVAVKPDFADAWFNLGNAYITQCKYRKAIEAFTKALRYTPEFGSAYKNIGFAYEQLKEYDRAESHYLEALKLNKTDGGIYINLANVYTQQGKLDKAKKQYVNAVRLSPKEPSGWMGLRDLALAKGDVSTYVKATRAILTRLSGDSLAESLAILRRFKNNDLLDDLLEQVDQADKHSVKLDAERLLACQRKEPASTKVRMLLKKLSSTPEPIPEVTCALAEYYLTDKKFEKAYELLQSIFDDDISHNILIWRSLIFLKRWKNAEETVNAYLRNHPDCSECWFYLAKIKASCGNRDEAEKMLIKAFEHGFSDLGLIEEDTLLNEIYGAMSNSGIQISQNR
ncbi:MAG: tetratricopeptide repeat protein [Chitinivibrionales bacterium]|nr:tetratricopeptide repeat protein [Chitinivibrionales bacterium]